MITTAPDGGFILPPTAVHGRTVAKGPRKHFTGQLVLRDEKTDSVADVESHTEMMTALVVTSRPDVMHLEIQVPFEWYDDVKGGPATHFFDFRATLRDGTRIAINVKAAVRLKSQRLCEELARLAAQVTPDFADQVVSFTEKNLYPIEIHNAELLYAVRLPEPEVDACARRVIQSLVGHCTIAGLMEEIGRSGQGIWAIARLLSTGELCLVHHQSITHDALVERRVS